MSEAADRVIDKRRAVYVERNGLTLDELFTRYLNVAIVVEPAAVPQIVRDPDDDHVLACALADLIVSGDQDLLVPDILIPVPKIEFYLDPEVRAYLAARAKQKGIEANQLVNELRRHDIESIEQPSKRMASEW